MALASVNGASNHRFIPEPEGIIIGSAHIVFYIIITTNGIAIFIHYPVTIIFEVESQLAINSRSIQGICTFVVVFKYSGCSPTCQENIGIVALAASQDVVG
jgi:hypothetical protein